MSAKAQQGVSPEIQNAIDLAVGAAMGVAQRVQSTLRNFGTITNQSTATLTAPTNQILAGISLISKSTGKYLVVVSGTATIGAVEAGGVTMFLSSNFGNTVGATITATNGTASGTNGFVSSSTTAITLSASSGTITPANQSSSNSLNNLTSSSLVTGFGLGAYLTGGFAIGAPAFFGLNVTFATSTVQVTGLSMFAIEMP